MNSEWLQYTMLRAASLLAPGDQRAEWLEEWRSELWYVPRRGAMLFCSGRFPGRALAETEQPEPAKRTGIHLESPLSCLALLAALAAVSIFIAVRLPDAAVPWDPGTCELATCRGHASRCSCFPACFCPAHGGMATPANRHPMPWPSRLRRGIFLALKIALLQPIMLCGFIVDARDGAAGRFAALGDRTRQHRCLALGDHGSAAPLPGVPAVAHQPGSHRHSVADVPGMVWRRVDVLARTWAAACFGDVVQSFPKSRSGSAWTIPGAVFFPKASGGKHDAGTAQRLEAIQRHPGRGQREFSGARRRDHRIPGAERVRQVHHHENDHRAAARPRPARFYSTANPSKAI